MSLASSNVDFFRDQWTERFIDTCVIARATGSSTNETTGQTETITAEIYNGECLVRPAPPREADYGEERIQVARYDLFLPWDAAELVEGDLVDVTSVHDALLTANELTVLRMFEDSYLTRRHYEAEEA